MRPVSYRYEIMAVVHMFLINGNVIIYYRGPQIFPKNQGATSNF